MTSVLNTKRNPCFKPSMIPTSFIGMVSFGLIFSIQNTAVNNNKTEIKMVNETPIWAINKPPAKGPKTEPNIHEVLLQVMACGRSSFFTNKGNNEKDAGAKNALIEPLKNIVK